MHETPTLFHARWKPGTLDTLIVTTENEAAEWPLTRFQLQFGRAAVARLYLTGRADLSGPPFLHNAAD
ncbi:hypothetical protein [Deinococcus ruber]|uniref:Uncharacterized protein n=1 Tax=Deinococcus ruber TaxID=1848197 RepID=A0A918CBK8_9DEIO|nr:hypothetical protein [Deinococcus ruber]GGR14384.1 hypothetical protein GCM10008957_28960 [Deinococcus ruber]